MSSIYFGSFETDTTTACADLNMGGIKITNLGTPISSDDIANAAKIEFNDESENVIITKEINLNKKSYIVEVYDTKGNIKYKKKNGIIQKKLK